MSPAGSPPKLSEGATQLLVSYIQSNISAALDSVATNAVAAGNPSIALPNPVSYFIYPKAAGYRLPAIFVISDDMDFRIQDKKANFINAKDYFNISALIEDQTEDNMTEAAWRYQQALYWILDEANILSSDNALKLIVVVYKSKISPTFMRTESSPGDGGKFRKEIVLQCQVEHMENY